MLDLPVPYAAVRQQKDIIILDDNRAVKQKILM